MYIPASFQVDDRDALFAFVDEFGFAALVSECEGELFATHVPLLLDRQRQTLLGHVARANPHAKALAAGVKALAIFTGPHGYISPSWYATAPAVPTWNYTAVHILGVSRPLTAEQTLDVVNRTVDKYEKHRPNPWPNVLPADYQQKMLAAIVGFEIPITHIEGKFKLSQNRSAEDQAGVVAALQNSTPEAQALAAFMQTATKPTR